MPYVYVYQCPACQSDLEITLGQEFRRDERGERVDYHYPAPDLYEWPPKRVAGVWNRLWCPHCRAAREHVLVELDEAAEHPVQAFLAAEARGLTGGETGPCPTCGTTLRIEVEDEPCPRCAEGRWVCIGEYEP